MTTEIHSDYLDSLLHGRDVVPEARAGWLKSLRAQAVERANALTVPTTRDEDWRFTDLSPLYRAPYRPSAQPGEVSAADLGRFEIPEAASRLTFVDGHYSAALSRIVPADGVLVANLADAHAAHGRLVESRLGTLSETGLDAFAAVNTAFLHDGALIHAGGDRNDIAPIHLLFIATRKDDAAYPRVLVIADPGAQCTLIEDFVGLADGGYFTDAVTEIIVGENAHVAHIKLQREAQAAFHIARTSVQVARDGRYSNWSVALGARISRHNLQVMQAGEGTDFSIDGLALIGGRQLADTNSLIDHARAHGRSRQLHKTVVGGGAHAVFNGKIFVRRDAQQTDSGQQSRNLLLSDKAHVDTKPQLEIFADDVKCAHGATVGQIEADELFYLKSRGLSDATARNLLTYAFAAEIIERIPVRSLVERLENHVLEQTRIKS
ncbi:MAG TPA: Fe-S cluster assembly protein SufD [Burkholderiales bacterium]|jgi:Fe-S cluster assembly protein SufD|nr:Fe-S cluster assembly protein SufD [Burkholderiales bacterium]